MGSQKAKGRSYLSRIATKHTRTRLVSGVTLRDAKLLLPASLSILLHITILEESGPKVVGVANEMVSWDIPSPRFLGPSYHFGTWEPEVENQSDVVGSKRQWKKKKEKKESECYKNAMSSNPGLWSCRLKFTQGWREWGCHWRHISCAFRIIKTKTVKMPEKVLLNLALASFLDSSLTTLHLATLAFFLFLADHVLPHALCTCCCPWV